MKSPRRFWIDEVSRQANGSKGFESKRAGGGEERKRMARGLVWKRASSAVAPIGPGSEWSDAGGANV